MGSTKMERATDFVSNSATMLAPHKVLDKHHSCVLHTLQCQWPSRRVVLCVADGVAGETARELSERSPYRTASRVVACVMHGSTVARVSSLLPLLSRRSRCRVRSVLSVYSLLRELLDSVFSAA